MDPRSPDSSGRPSLAHRIAAALEHKPALQSLSSTGMFVIAVCVVLYLARSVFVPLALASMLYFLLRPAVRSFAALRLSKAAGSTVVMVGLLAALSLIVFEASAPATAWARRLPDILHTLESRVRPLRQPVQKVSQIAERVERATQVKAERPVTQVAVQEGDWLDTALSVVTEFAAEALVLVIGLYFMLIYGDVLLERLLGFFPDLGERARTAQVLNEIERRMGQYLRTITLINACLGLVSGLTFSALGVPNPWLFAAIGAIANYVPYLGALSTMCLLALVSFVSYPAPWQALLPPLAYLLLTTIEGNFITPLILGRAFRVSPLVIFVWLVFWTWLWGVPGAVIAVPLLMLIKITCEQSETLVWLTEIMES